MKLLQIASVGAIAYAGYILLNRNSKSGGVGRSDSVGGSGTSESVIYPQPAPVVYNITPPEAGAGALSFEDLRNLSSEDDTLVDTKKKRSRRSNSSNSSRDKGVEGPPERKDVDTKKRKRIWFDVETKKKRSSSSNSSSEKGFAEETKKRKRSRRSNSSSEKEIVGPPERKDVVKKKTYKLSIFDRFIH